jgi:hypothetical protein
VLGSQGLAEYLAGVPAVTVLGVLQVAAVGLQPSEVALIQVPFAASR